jgi:hypothetical protein
LNFILICLRFIKGSTIKRQILFVESSFNERIPRDSSVRGKNLDGKLPFPLMSKGERFFRCMERELDVWREKRGMILGGMMVTGEKVLQCCIRVFPSMTKEEIVD